MKHWKQGPVVELDVGVPLYTDEELNREIHSLNIRYSESLPEDEKREMRNVQAKLIRERDYRRQANK